MLDLANPPVPTSIRNAGALSLSDVLDQLAGHDDKALTMDYADNRQLRAGSHVTEVKAGQFMTLDCGSNADSWNETILQVEDLDGPEDRRLTAGKFRAILGKVAKVVALDAEARLTIEVGRPGEAMRVHDVVAVHVGNGEARLDLGERPAICKPRHRAAAGTEACCAAGTSAKSCCA